jgi:ectoine hydroxylase-related dioxygenase (phytanoyl-CoA dioxygenase family)
VFIRLQPAVGATVDAAAKQFLQWENAGEFRLSPAQIAGFFEDGFVIVERIADIDEIAGLQEIYDAVFTERRGWDVGDLFDLTGVESPDRELQLPQMFWPSHYAPELARSRLYRNAHRAAHQLLGAEARCVFEHAILKPPHCEADTPWHQDDAFNRIGTGYSESISVWMPLQDVSLQNGCLHYVPGSHRGPLFPHRSLHGDSRIHALEALPLTDAESVAVPVPVPVPAGAAVIHHSRTLHWAGPNATAQPRRACTLGFAVTSWRSGLRRDHEWNLLRQTARDTRQRAAAPLPKRIMLRMRDMARRHGLYFF